MNQATAVRPQAAHAAAAPIVEVRGIDKVYPGGVQALQGVDLAFEEGALTSLLGPRITSYNVCYTKLLRPDRW